MEISSIDFYYWSYQCPLHHELLQLLKEYSDRLPITTYDIAKQPELAVKMQLYFPMLLVVNHEKRYYAPFGVSFLETLCQGILPEQMPYRPIQGNELQDYNCTWITENTITTACECTGGCCESSINKKKAFYKQIKQEMIGCMIQDEKGQLLGGAEYVPSIIVPYDIPKAKGTAFLTCVYKSDEIYDYKSAPLMELEAYLSLTYESVCVITDEVGNFPNGDLRFFLNHGYQDTGVIYVDETYCSLHVMHKRLK